MSAVRFTLRRKLLAIVALSALAFVAIIAATLVIGERTTGQVDRIQNDYVPRVQLEPRLEATFERLRRSFQDAVGAGDVDALNDSHTIEAAFFRELDAAAGALDPAQRAQLQAALEDYVASARDVSRRLIASETGERLTADIAAMQRKQAHVVEIIRATTSFDEGELTAALSSVKAAAARALRYQLAISIACLVALALVSVALARSVVRGLSELTAGFARFGTGAFEKPITVIVHDEVGAVAQRANQMAASLERLDRENKVASAALKSSNRELEAFAYSVAHDLRAPLRAISGFAEILAEETGDALPDEGKECIETITRNARKMGLLIDALLSLSRVSRKELNLRRVDLSDIARDEAAQLAKADPGRSVEVSIQDGVSADADPGMARALLQNLLGNAWKFSGKTAAARVEFGVADKDGARAFFVRDNGAGFDMAHAEKLFGAFQRLHTEAEFTGTGIGLATVQRIVLRHGGRIWAEGAVNAGATFYFTLSS